MQFYTTDKYLLAQFVLGNLFLYNYFIEPDNQVPSGTTRSR